MMSYQLHGYHLPFLLSTATRFVDYFPPDFGFVADLSDSAAGEICYEAASIVDDPFAEDTQCFRVAFTVQDDSDSIKIGENSSAIYCINDNDRELT